MHWPFVRCRFLVGSLGLGAVISTSADFAQERIVLRAMVPRRFEPDNNVREHRGRDYETH
jgi:hypothetical protein